jgi:uncharacterized protein YycO
MTWKKYEMSAAKWAELREKIETTGTDPEGETYATWDPAKVVAVVELGKLCKGWDAEGNCTDLSTKESIDILWVDAPVTGFATYAVNVAPGSEAHQFAGMAWE